MSLPVKNITKNKAIMVHHITQRQIPAMVAAVDRVHQKHISDRMFSTKRQSLAEKAPAVIVRSRDSSDLIRSRQHFPQEYLSRRYWTEDINKKKQQQLQSHPFSIQAWSRMSTTISAHPGIFDAEMTKGYMSALEQNRHPHGPWSHILKHAEEIVHGHVHDKMQHQITILDLASGPGEPAATLSARIPEAKIYATDASASMVEAATQRMKELGLKNVTTQAANMEDLSDFDDESFDLVTCSFGLAYAEHPEKALEEVHRVLKPGGSFISTVWENIQAKRVLDIIMQKVMGGTAPPPPSLVDPTSLARPHLLENMIENCGLSLIQLDEDEYPFEMSSSDNAAFRAITVPIWPTLSRLVVSGERPRAFEDARAAFDQVVSEGELIMTDPDGKLKTKPNRFKTAVARRKYEDGDGKRRRKKTHHAKHAEVPDEKVALIASSKKQMSDVFDSVLADTYSRIHNSPWRHVLKMTEEVLDLRNDMSNVQILDVASGTGELATKLASKFKDASLIMATDFSPEMVEGAKKRIKELGLKNMEAKVADMQDLSVFQSGSFDVVTCCFGLTFLSEPEKALDEIHRVLKPGGSLIALVWDSISLERMSDEIMDEVMGGKMPPARILDHRSFAKPRKLEGLIEGSGMSIIRVDHNEFPIQLTGLEDEPKDFAFNVATVPIHPNLVELEKSGKRPNAIEDAKEAFEKIVSKGELVSFDSEGNMVTAPNRFKMVIARRQFEDADGYLNK